MLKHIPAIVLALFSLITFYQTWEIVSIYCTLTYSHSFIKVFFLTVVVFLSLRINFLIFVWNQFFWEIEKIPLFGYAQFLEFRGYSVQNVVQCTGMWWLFLSVLIIIKMTRSISERFAHKILCYAIASLIVMGLGEWLFSYKESFFLTNVVILFSLIIVMKGLASFITVTLFFLCQNFFSQNSLSFQECLLHIQGFYWYEVYGFPRYFSSEEDLNGLTIFSVTIIIISILANVIKRWTWVEPVREKEE